MPSILLAISSINIQKNMVKKSLLLIYRATLWGVGIITSITLVAALVIQFVLMPNINEYKDKIAGFVEKTSQRKITIANIKADWQGINPHFTLSNIEIFDTENRPALQLKNTELSLSWLSILLFEPHFNQLSINSPELTIRRIKSGEIFFSGISLSGPSKPDLANWLLRQTKLNVLNAKVIWLDEMRAAPALSLDHLDLEVFSPPWRSLLKNHRLTMRTKTSTGSIYPIEFSGSIFGNDVSQLDKWHGSINIKLEQADLTAFKPWIDYPLDLQSGVGSSTMKISFANHQLESLSAEVALDQVRLLLKTNAEPVLLNKLNGKLSWEKLKNTKLFSLTGYDEKSNQVDFGQKISFKDLSFSTNKDLNLQNAAANLTFNSQGDIKLGVELAHIDLALLNAYLDYLPLSVQTIQKINQIEPSGQLNALSINWEGSASTTKKYQLSTKFEGLSVKALSLDKDTNLPGFSNLSGNLKANESNGILKLQTQNAQLDLNPILRWMIPAESLEGNITWNIKDKASRIYINNLNISNPHLAGTINANYLMDGIKGGLLDLNAHFDQANLKYAPFYYPATLGVDTTHWLDTSIIEGRADGINVTIKGRLADFPFVDSKNNLDSKLGLFRVTANIHDAKLAYGEDWPSIEGLGLNMLFEGNRMELNAFKGLIYGNQIVKSKITIPQLDAKNPMLSIVSEVKGAVPELIKFVNNSPVVTVASGFTNNLVTTGNGKLNLSLKIPLQNIDATQYLGQYQIINASMSNPDIPMTSQVNGILEFTESSFNAKNISASAYGAPLSFTLNSGKDKVIHVSAKGKMNSDLFQQILGIKPTPGKPINYVSGNADWVGEMTIQKPQINMDLRSDLVGFTLRLPAPLTKAANERLPLHLIRKQDVNTEIISATLGSKLSAKGGGSFINGRLQLDRATINFNDGKATSKLPSNDLVLSPGLQISGELDHLDADAWRNLLSSTQEVATDEFSLPVKKIAVKINTLDIFGRRINQLKLTNILGKEGFQATVQSREISGDIEWINQKNGKVIARLSNLIVPDSIPGLEASPSVTKDFKKLTQDYPALDITSDNFEFNKKNYGSLELVASPQNDNWEIKKIKFSSPDGTISAEGQWNNWIRSPNTNLNVLWDIKDLGNTLNRLGYPDTIKGGQGEVKGQLNWAGSPHDFNTAHLNGILQFELKKGQILKVQPGVGRLLGLLSLQSLPRRLSLDFRDLFSNGFAFDKISARVKVDNGILHSDNFKMGGPAADVTIRGETNIQTETQQLTVKVMPHISDSLSLAALAGGPLVGAVAFLAQKILKDPLNKIASSEYEIIGTWDNPQEEKASNANEDNTKSNMSK